MLTGLTQTDNCSVAEYESLKVADYSVDLASSYKLQVHSVVLILSPCYGRHLTQKQQTALSFLQHYSNLSFTLDKAGEKQVHLHQYHSAQSRIHRVMHHICIHLPLFDFKERFKYDFIIRVFWFSLLLLHNSTGVLFHDLFPPVQNASQRWCDVLREEVSHKGVYAGRNTPYLETNITGIYKIIHDKHVTSLPDWNDGD